MEESSKTGYMSTVAFLVSTHFMIHVFTDVVPAILPTLRAELGIGLIQSSLLVSVPLLVQVFFYIPAGIISDRRYVATLVAGFVVTAIAAFIIPFSTTFVLIIIGFSLLHLGSTLYHPPSLKAASDVPVSRLNRVMALHLAGGSLGLATGPIVLGALMPTFGWRFVFYLWIAPVLIVSLFPILYSRGRRARIKKADQGIYGSFRSLLSGPFLIIIVMGVLAEATFVNLGTFTTTFFTGAIGMSPSMASMIFGIGPMVGIMGALGGSSLSDRLGTRRAMFAILLTISGSLAALSMAQNSVSAALLYIFYRAWVSAVLALMNVLITTNSPSSSRSLAFSLYFLIVNLAGALAPSATSVLVETTSIIAIFPVSIIMIAAAMSLLFILKGQA